MAARADVAVPAGTEDNPTLHRGLGNRHLQLIAIGGATLARPIVNRFGLESRLAVDNSARNPKRTATTANALLIGVFLVTLVTVAGQSVKDFAIAEIQNAIKRVPR